MKRQKIQPNIDKKSLEILNKDFLFTSDWHLHDRKDLSKIDPTTGLGTRLMEGYYVIEQILEQAKKYVFCLGDIFELKDRIPNHILILLQHILQKFEERKIPLYVLEGNHDYGLLNYPAMELFRSSPYFSFIDKPAILEIEGIKMGFIPFQREWKNFQDIWNEFSNRDLDVVCFHQYVSGVTYESGKVVEQEEDVIRKKNVLYLSGHAHFYQQVGGIHYLGSPYQFKFGDVGIEKYIWFLDPKTKDISSKKLNYPRFIDIDCSSQFYKEDIEGNYVRIVGEISNETWKTLNKREIRENLEKAGAKAVIFNIKTVESFKPSTIKKTGDFRVDLDLLIKEFVRENFQSEEDINDVERIGKEIWDHVD